MDKFEMELMDWKEMERQAEAQFRGAHVQLVLARLLYEESIINIKKLGGITNREQDTEEAKKREHGTVPPA